MRFCIWNKCSGDNIIGTVAYGNSMSQWLKVSIFYYFNAYMTIFLETFSILKTAHISELIDYEYFTRFR